MSKNKNYDKAVAAIESLKAKRFSMGDCDSFFFADQVAREAGIELAEARRQLARAERANAAWGWVGRVTTKKRGRTVKYKAKMWTAGARPGKLKF